MSIIDKLASSLGRRDEMPNKELAGTIVKRKDRTAVDELVSNLQNKDNAIQSDCIKSLYEIGERDPGLLSGHIPSFIKLLSHKNNRMVWGGMSALARIAAIDPAGIYKHLAIIMDAADKGSVITKDNAVRILVCLSSDKKFKGEAIPLLLEQIRNCPINQMPMYAEMASTVISTSYKEEYLKTLSKRMDETEKPSAIMRLKKLMAKIEINRDIRGFRQIRH